MPLTGLGAAMALERLIGPDAENLQNRSLACCWRCGWESNPRVRVLQTLALPLGYRTEREDDLFGTYRAKPFEVKLCAAPAGSTGITGSVKYEACCRS